MVLFYSISQRPGHLLMVTVVTGNISYLEMLTCGLSSQEYQIFNSFSFLDRSLCDALLTVRGLKWARLESMCDNYVLRKRLQSDVRIASDAIFPRNGGEFPNSFFSRETPHSQSTTVTPFAIKILLRAASLHRRHVIKYILTGPNINGINQRDPDKHPTRRGETRGQKLQSVINQSRRDLLSWRRASRTTNPNGIPGPTISSSFFHIPADRIFYPALRHKAHRREIRIRRIIGIID